MKRNLVFIGMVSLLISSCTVTPVQKAERLIEEQVRKTLVLPDSYDPIETLMDSTYSPLESEEFVSILGDFLQQQTNLDKYHSDEGELKASLILLQSGKELFSYGGSNFAKSMYSESKAACDSCQAQLKSVQAKIKATQSLSDSLKTVLQLELSQPREFYGFKATHSYRSTNNQGEISINKYVFVFDNKITKIQYYMSLEDYQKRVDAINTAVKFVQTGELPED